MTGKNHSAIIRSGFFAVSPFSVSRQPSLISWAVMLLTAKMQPDIEEVMRNGILDNHNSLFSTSADISAESESAALLEGLYRNLWLFDLYSCPHSGDGGRILHVILDRGCDHPPWLGPYPPREFASLSNEAAVAFYLSCISNLEGKHA